MIYRRFRRKEDTTTTSYKKTIIFTNIYIKFFYIFKISLYKCNMFLEHRFCSQASENEINNRLQVEIKDRCKEKGSMTSSIKCTIIGKPLSLPKTFTVRKHTIPPRVESTTFHFMWKAQHSTSCGKHIIPLRVEKTLSISSGQKIFYPPCVGRYICLIKNYSIYHDIQLNLNQRHADNYIKSKLINDIETNPGPGEK
jgi:hypothetical protein